MLGPFRREAEGSAQSAESGTGVPHIWRPLLRQYCESVRGTVDRCKARQRSKPLKVPAFAPRPTEFADHLMLRGLGLPRQPPHFALMCESSSAGSGFMRCRESPEAFPGQGRAGTFRGWPKRGYANDFGVAKPSGKR